ncbi:MAG: DUF4238 domain-containing protein [Methylocella sp.]
MSNDHYVSQFYFRNFSPDRPDGGSDGPEGGSIRLINLIRRKFVPTASIKGQCKKAGFHDYKPGLESALGQLEGSAASAIRGVIEASVPPKLRSADHQALCTFIAIQRSRTLSAAENADKMADRMFKVAYESDPGLEGIDLAHYELKSPYPVAIPLSMSAQCAPIAMELGFHVFVNETSEEFVTSDNPVVAHNQYCEGIDYQGVLGWNCAGIQILFPISPRHLVLLYDAKDYSVGAKHDRSTSRIVDVAEIRNLNAFQILTARENIYFSNDAMVGPLLAQIERLDFRRRCKRHITVQTRPIADGDRTSELIHQFERMLPLKFCIGSVRIKRNMRRISVNRRAAMVRAPEPVAGNRPSGEPGSALQYVTRRSFSD